MPGRAARRDRRDSSRRERQAAAPGIGESPCIPLAHHGFLDSSSLSPWWSRVPFAIPDRRPSGLARSKGVPLKP
jgi:hypothetical protein